MDQRQGHFDVGWTKKLALCWICSPKIYEDKALVMTFMMPWDLLHFILLLLIKISRVN